MEQINSFNCMARSAIPDTLAIQTLFTIFMGVDDAIIRAAGDVLDGQSRTALTNYISIGQGYACWVHAGVRGL
jgi:hypothetical protein